MEPDRPYLREPPVRAIDRLGESAVVRLVGELDLHNAEEVRRALLGCLDDGAGRVVADLGDVTFVDSTVLGAFIEAARRGDLVLAAPGAEPRRALEISGLDQVLTLADSVDEAVR
jgi:anti-sigma B factor antagonist